MPLLKGITDAWNDPLTRHNCFAELNETTCPSELRTQSAVTRLSGISVKGMSTDWWLKIDFNLIFPYTLCSAFISIALSDANTKGPVEL